MSKTPEPSEPPILVLWERPEPSTRPVPSPLSRDLIVSAAIAIADSEGLQAVSLRKVGTALDTGAMRLYGYIATKEELLDLMVDAIYGEMVTDEPISNDWRQVLKSMAHGMREISKKHHWFVELSAGRPHFGPNALDYREVSFGALCKCAGFENIDFSMFALRTVIVYMIGIILHETSELRIERESGMNRTERKAAAWPYIERMIATGRYPMLEKIVHEATHPTAEAAFERGLDCVLDGIAAQL